MKKVFTLMLLASILHTYPISLWTSGSGVVATTAAPLLVVNDKGIWVSEHGVSQLTIKGASLITSLASLQSIYATANRDDFGLNTPTICRLGLGGTGLTASIYLFLNAHKF